MFSLRSLRLIQVIVSRNKYTNLYPSTINNFAGFHSEDRHIKRKPLFRSSAYKDGIGTSQYVQPPPLEVAHSKILEYISENNPKTFEDWREAKEFFYTEIPLLTDVNYSSVLLSVLLGKNLFLSAESFMKYLVDSNIEPNSLTYLQYMSICGRNVDHFGQEVILESWKRVQNSIDVLPVLDRKRGTYIIQGLCGTDQWRRSFDYLKKILNGPNIEIKSCLASAAIKNGDDHLAWEILTKWIKQDESLCNHSIADFLKYANKLQSKYDLGADRFLVKFFRYLEERDIIINKEEANLIEQYFNCHASEWKISYSKVTRTANCAACQKSLNFIEISDQEFEYLRNSFLEKSVKKNDIFINTTQEEFDRYLKFLDRRKPYHIVIDGLNAAYTVQEKKNPRSLSYHLFRVVKELSRKDRKILLLGRDQMRNWPRTIMKKITDRADFFLTSNASQDDPFTVYAALASGPHTYVLSLDLMRDHMSRLNNQKLINLFKKWQQSHQILLAVDEDNELRFTEPIRHAINVQGSMEKGWHIPVEDNIIRDPYEELNNWLCIERKF